MWVVAAGASALSLGNARGSVFLGGQVDLTFEVRPDPGVDVASSCLAAKVMSGDTPIGDAKVRLVPVPETRGGGSAVRVLANVAVDEPVLTVTLTAGCSGKITRTYTFLADPPVAVAPSRATAAIAAPALPLAGNNGASGESASGAPTAFAGQAASGVLLQPAGKREEGGGAARIPASAGAVQRSAPVVSRSRSERMAPAAPLPAKVLRTTPSSPNRSRLVVEPLDTWLDSPVSLRSTSQLPSLPSEQTGAQRAEAAALWKSLNLQPQDLQKDADRVAALQAETVALRSSSRNDQAAAVQLREQLERAQQERFPANVVYALGALLLAALLLLAWMGWRLRSTSHKAVQAWHDAVALGAREAALAPEKAAQLLPTPADTWTPPETLPTPPDPAPVPVGDATPPVPQAAPLEGRAAPVGGASEGAAPARGLHIVNPEELFDIQQQAEFFISVGEHQQAIEVLKNHIAVHRETSPLAYLELLRLYHTLSRVDEFVQLRMRFMQSFNAQVPEFAGFHRAGRELDCYTEALAQIEAQWTSPSVLVLLEQLLFRREGVESIEPFDLAAYDDLLLLFSIAQTTPASARGEPPPRRRTTPFQIESRPEPVANAVQDRAVQPDGLQPDSRAAGLDFDFDFDLQPPERFAEARSAGTGQSRVDRDMADAQGVPLDLDLSDHPHLTISDLPPVPVTAPPLPGQAVGFGMNNDRVELRMELGEQTTDRP